MILSDTLSVLYIGSLQDNNTVNPSGFDSVYFGGGEQGRLALRDSTSPFVEGAGQFGIQPWMSRINLCEISGLGDAPRTG